MRRALRALVRRDPSPAKRFARFQADVEPRLAAVPRVHRFAAVPVLGDARTPAQPIAVAELTDTRAPWVALADVPLEPAALERLGQAATLAPDAAVITCDEDVRRPDGRRSDPRFHPGPSPDSLLAADGPLAVLCVRREPALAALAEIPDTPAWRQELLLRLGGPDGAGHAHVPAILAHRSASAAGRGGVDAVVASARGLGRHRGPRHRRAGHRRVTHPVAGEPLVEVVVLFRDKPELLERCARSVLGRTEWDRLRLRLVDNGSSDPRIAEMLRRLERDQRVVVARDDRPFNFAALNNAALAAATPASSSSSTTTPRSIAPDWVQGLLAEAQRPEVGAVAPLLRYPGGAVQHAGAALGLHGYAGHPFAGLRPTPRRRSGARDAARATGWR